MRHGRAARRQVGWGTGQSRGFTLVEVLTVVAIIATLAGIAVPAYFRTVDRARIDASIGEIYQMQKDISMYRIDEGRLPDALADLGRGVLLDPWGRPYQYLNFDNVNGKGSMRKDRFLVPINSDYDLYSMGGDGRSTTTLTATDSRDDIIRAGDGAFVGLASEY
jgi:general secretion pathway protein G